MLNVIRTLENSFKSVRAASLTSAARSVFVSIFAIATVLTLGAGCSDDSSTEPELLREPRVNSVSLEPATLSLRVGDEHRVQVSFDADEGVSDRSVVFLSDDSEIASVDDNGRITAESPGTTTISAVSAADPSKKGTTRVTVTGAEIALSITPSAAELAVGQSVTLAADLRGDRTGAGVEWTSLDPSVVSVQRNAQGNGVVTAHQAGGPVVIQAVSKADASVSASASITVSAGEVTSIQSVTVSPEQVTLQVGAEQLLSARVEVSGTGAIDRGVTWTSSNPSVVTVDEEGRITGLAEGSARVIATSKADANQSADAVVNVTPLANASVQIASITDANNRPADERNLEGTFGVVVRVDEGDETPREVRLLVDGEQVAAIPMSNGRRASQDLSLAVDSAELRPGAPGGVRFKNGSRTLTAQLITDRGTVSQNRVVTFNNPDTFALQVAATGNQATDAAGRIWNSGDLLVTVTPRTYSNTSIRALTAMLQDGRAVFTAASGAKADGSFEARLVMPNFTSGPVPSVVSVREFSTSDGRTQTPAAGAPTAQVNIDNAAPVAGFFMALNNSAIFTDGWMNSGFRFASVYQPGIDAVFGASNVRFFAGSAGAGNSELREVSSAADLADSDGFDYRVIAVETDALGNASAPVALNQNFGVDTTSPTIEPAANSVSNGQIVTNPAAARWEVRVRDGRGSGFNALPVLRKIVRRSVVGEECLNDLSCTATPDALGASFATAPFADGYYDCTQSAIDKVGNRSTELKVTAVIDQTKPALTNVGTAESGALGAGQTVHVTGRATDTVDLISARGGFQYAGEFYALTSASLGRAFDAELTTLANLSLAVPGFLPHIETVNGAFQPTGVTKAAAKAVATVSDVGGNAFKATGDVIVAPARTFTANEVTTWKVTASANQVNVGGSITLNLELNSPANAMPFEQILVLDQNRTPVGPYEVRVDGTATLSSTGPNVFTGSYQFTADSDNATGQSLLRVIGVTADGRALETTVAIQII